MNQETLVHVTYRMPANLHEEVQRTARRLGISQSKFVRDTIEQAVLGTRCHTADRVSLSTVIWISEYLMAATKRDKEDVARLWEIAEGKADAILR